MNLDKFIKNSLKEEFVLDEGLLQDISSSFKNLTAKIKSQIRATKVWMKKIGKKVIAFYIKDGETGIVDPTNNKVAAKWTPISKGHMTIIINPKLKQQSIKKQPLAIPESQSFFGKMLNELDTPEEVTKKASKRLDKVGQKLVTTDIPSGNDLMNIETAEVDYKDLEDILSEQMFKLKFRSNFDDFIPSVLIMGPPGGGKTAFINRFSKKMGTKLYTIEIASLYTEIIGGVPVITKEYLEKKTGKKLSDEEIMKLGDDAESTSRVDLIASSLFPPDSDESGAYILFLDEFNKDNAKMNAAMNLILSGNIGTTYKLPLKTIVIVAGNQGTEIDGVSVADMDAAVFDRFDRKVVMGYDYEASLEYLSREINPMKKSYYNKKIRDAKTPKEKNKWLELMTKELGDKGEDAKLDPDLVNITDAEFEKYSDEINAELMPSALSAFINRKTKETGTKNWSIDLEQFSEGSSGETFPGKVTPRTFEKIARSVFYKALKDWIDNNEKGKPLVGKHDADWYREHYKNPAQEDEDDIIVSYSSPFEYYMQKNQWHKEYLPDVLRTSLGGDPGPIISEIQQFDAVTRKESKSMSIPKVLTSYVLERNKVEDKEEAFAYLVENLPSSIANLIGDIGTEARLKAMVGKNDKKYSKKDFILKSGGKDVDMKNTDNLINTWAKGDLVRFVVKNVATFFKDLSLGEEAVTTIIEGLMENQGLSPVLKNGKTIGSSGEIKKEKKKNELVTLFLAELINLEEKDGKGFGVFKSTFDLIVKARSADDDLNPEAAAKAKAFARKGQYTDGTSPSSKIKKAFGSQLESFLTIINFDSLAPTLSKKARLKIKQQIETKSANESIDIGFKNLLSRML